MNNDDNNNNNNNNNNNKIVNGLCQNRLKIIRLLIIIFNPTDSQSQH